MLISVLLSLSEVSLSITPDVSLAYLVRNRLFELEVQGSILQGVLMTEHSITTLGRVGNGKLYSLGHA